jgi:hypothetical protein
VLRTTVGDREFDVHLAETDAGRGKIARSCRQPAVIVSIWPRDAALDNGALCMRQNRPSINLTAVDAAIMGILRLL